MILHRPRLQYRPKVSWQSLTSRSSRRETRFSILEIFEDRVSRLEDRVSSFDDQRSSFKFRFKKALSLKVYTYLSFEKSRLLALGETRLLSPKRSSRFESENVRFWSPVNSPFETCFLEVKARYIYVIAFKKSTTTKQLILETTILISLVHSIQL